MFLLSLHELQSTILMQLQSVYMKKGNGWYMLWPIYRPNNKDAVENLHVNQ